MPTYRFTTQPLFYGSDEAARAAMPARFYESMEKLPDPPIVKKFEVEVTFPPSAPPDDSDYAKIIHGYIVRPFVRMGLGILGQRGRQVSVKEIS